MWQDRGNSFYVRNLPLVRAKPILDHTSNLSRKNAVRLLRICAGTTADPAYLHKIRKRSSEQCICGAARATIVHLMWECVQFQIARSIMEESIACLHSDFRPISSENKHEFIIQRLCFAPVFEFLDQTGISV